MIKRPFIGIAFFLLISLIMPAITAYAADPSPREVYILKQKALEALDFNEFGKYLTKENYAGLKQALDLKNMMFLIRKLRTPTEFTVEKEEINGNSAVIYLKGKFPLDPNNPEKIEPGYGKATFKKEGTSWKFINEKWQTNAWKQ